MFTFKWSYDYGTIKAIYEDNWKQLGQCSAAIAHVIDEDKNYLIDNFYFNSYVTPIMMISRIRVKRINVESITVCVNKDYFGCSNTTIRQTSKFLNYVNAFMILGFDYHDIKATIRTIENSDANFSYISDEKSPMVFECANSAMETMFKKYAGYWTHHSI